MVFKMTGSVKYEQVNWIFSFQLKFREEDVFQAPGLLDINFKMTGSLKYKQVMLNFSSQLKYPEENIFQAPGILNII